jgi:LysM repeat protein
MDDLQGPTGIFEEKSPIPSTKAGLPLLNIAGLVFGLMGCFLGVYGIMEARAAKTALQESENQLKTALEARPDRTEEFARRLKELDESIVGVGSEVMKTNRALTGIRDQTQSALTEMGRDIRANRAQVNENTNRIGELDEKIKTPPPPVASQARTNLSTGTTTTSQSGNRANFRQTDGTQSPEGSADRPAEHRIKPGDTLSKLADLYGLSLDDILDANPGIDPRRLQVGQPIRLPQ